MSRKISNDNPKKNNVNSLQKLNIIHDLITTGSESIDFIKQYLIEEYSPDSTTEYMIISQIIDIFIRLNRLQYHIKNSVEYNRQRFYQEEITEKINQYEYIIQKDIGKNKYYLIDEKDPDYYDWETHQKLVNAKRIELEQELYDYQKINETELRYFLQDKTIREEEKHLIDCLIKYLNLLEGRKTERQNQRLKLELLKTQIKSKQIYDY